MKIKILGSGCRKCNKLENNVKKTLKNNDISAEIEHVTDITEIVDYGIMSTPALVIDEKVVSAGKILKEKEIIDLLQR